MKKKFLLLFSVLLSFVLLGNVNALEISITESDKDAVVLSEGNTTNYVTDHWNYDASENKITFESTDEIDFNIETIKVTGESTETLTLYFKGAFWSSAYDDEDESNLISEGPKMIITGSEEGNPVFVNDNSSAIVIGAGGLVVDGVKLTASNTNFEEGKQTPDLVTSPVSTSISLVNKATFEVSNPYGNGIVLENSTFTINRSTFIGYSNSDVEFGSVVKIKTNTNPFTFANVKDKYFPHYIEQNDGYYYLDGGDIIIVPDEIYLTNFTFYDGEEEACEIVLKYANGKEVDGTIPGERLFYEIKCNEGFEYDEDTIEFYYYNKKWDTVSVSIDKENKSFVMPNIEELYAALNAYSKEIRQVKNLYLDAEYGYIDWEQINNVDGYEVYRSTSKSSGYKLVGTIEEQYPGFSESTAKVKVTYYYKVRAYRIGEDGVKEYGPFSDVVSGYYKMSAPETLVSEHDYNTNYISIMSYSIVDGYEIYRYNSSTKKWVKIKTIKASSDSIKSVDYYDNNVKLGSTYKYKVRSYSISGSKTYYSSYTSVQTVKTNIAVPEITINSINGETANISWEKVAKATKYNVKVYRIVEDYSDEIVYEGTKTSNSILLNGLETEGDYRIVVQAVYGSYKNSSDYYFTQLDTPALTVNDNGKDVTVSWNTIEAADSYELCYIVNMDFNSLKCIEKGDYTVEGNVVSYTIKNIGKGNNVYGAVVANYVLNKGTEDEEKLSSESIFINHTIEVTNNTELSISKVNYKTAQLSWTEEEGVDGYILYRSTDNKNWSKVYTGSETTFKETLTTGKKYYYKVRTYAKVGEKTLYSKNYSETKNITLKVDTPNVSVSKTSYNYNTLTWNKISGAYGYAIYRSTDNKSFKLIKTITSGSTLTYKDSSLTTNTTYYYKVKAYRTVSGSKKYGNYSSVVSGKPYLKTTTVTGTNGYYGYTKINFTKVSGATGYRIYRSETEDGTYTTIGYTTNTYYNDKTALEDKEYYYKVKPYRTVSGSKKYADASNATSALRISDTITFSASKYNYTSNKITISKDANATKYYIYRSTSSKGTYSKIATLYAKDFVNDIEFLDKSLTFNKTYYYKVKMVYKNTSDYSTYKSRKTALTGAPTTTGTNEYYGYARINFTKVSGASGYAIYRSEEIDGEYKQIGKTTNLYYLDKTAKEEVNYYYKVRAYRKSGSSYIYSSEYSNVVEASRVDSKIEVTLSVSDKNNVNISFNSVEGATKYYIYRSTSKTKNFEKIATVNENSYIDNKLSYNKTYYYKVKAVNKDSGNLSAVVGIKTESK